MRKRIFWEVILLLFFSLTPLIWFTGNMMLLGHDSGFRLLPLVHLKNLFYSWNSFYNVGKDWSLYKAFIITQFPEAFFSLLTGSILWGQRLALILWFFLIGFGMWLGIYLVLPDKKYRFFRIWSPMFAMYNFYILQGWFIAERAKFSLFAALPISLALLYRTIMKKESIIRNAIFFGLLYLVLNGGGSPPLYGSSVIGLFIIFVWLTVISIKKNGARELIRCVQIGIAFFISFIILNFYWIFPQVNLYFSTYNQALSDAGGIEGLIAWEQGISKNSSIVNLLRLQGIPDWYDNVYNVFAKNFLTNPFLIALSYLPLILVLLCGFYLIQDVLKKKKTELHTFFAGLFLLLGIGLILTAGSHPPVGFLFVWAMRHVPGFAIFRSSFYKFAPMVWIPVILLSGYALNRFLYTIRSKVLTIILSIALIGFILAYHYPYFTADIFHFTDSFSTRVSVPSYVTKMGEYVNASTETDARIMLLPALDPGYYNVLLDTSSWGYFSLDILPRSILSRGIIANDNDANSVVTSLYASLRNNDKKTFLQIAHILGVKYVLWRDDAVYKSNYEDNRSISTQKYSFLSWNFAEVKNFGLWTLYAVPDPSPLKRIYVAKQIVLASGINIQYADILSRLAKNPETAIVDSIPSTVSSSIDAVANIDVIQATCIACSLKEQNDIANGVTLSDLPYPPGSLLFQRKAQIESDALKNASTNPSKIDAQLIAADTKLQSVKWYLQHNQEQNVITDIEVYKTIMGNVFQLTAGLAGKTKNDYEIRIISFLHAQQRYIETQGFTEDRRNILNPLVSSYIQRISDEVWMTAGSSVYKQEVEIPQPGMYTIVYQIPENSLVIDGQPTTVGNIQLNEGYHKISAGSYPIYFIRNNTAGEPNVTVSSVKRDPTKYTGEIITSSPQFIMIFNEQFDKRWKMKLDGRVIPEMNHIRADGYANAWILETEGRHTFEVYFEPQNDFYYGSVVSIIGLLASFSVLIKCKQKQVK